MQYVSYDLINDNPASIQIMAWYQTNDKPLSELVIAYMHYWASKNLSHLAIQQCMPLVTWGPFY